MLVGPLNRRIRLRRFTTTRTAPLNTPVKAWADLASVWANHTPISDGERIAAEQVSATVTDRFQIRWAKAWADLNPKDRLVFKGLEYAIRSVKEIGRQDGLEITAYAVADQAQA